MDTNETTELADLALTNGQQAEVKGGTTPIASVTDLVIDPFQSSASSGSQHPSGVNICLGDGSVR